MLVFVWGIEVPFENDLAERDLLASHMATIIYQYRTRIVPGQ
jgi:hypothetical protein